MTTDSEQVYQTFDDKNQCNDNKNADVESKIIQTKHCMVKKKKLIKHYVFLNNQRMVKLFFFFYMIDLKINFVQNPKRSWRA